MRRKRMPPKNEKKMTIHYCEGERIYFRPIELEDEPQLRLWRNDPKNRATLKNVGPMNALREREWIEKLYKDTDDIALGICLKDGQRLIGACGLHRVRLADRSAVFGILIGDREYQNHGFGTEATKLMLRLAFEELNLNRVGLSVLAGNRRGIQVYEKVGFVREGCVRQSYFRGGGYQDELYYGMLRSEWERHRFRDEAEQA
jgi:RimJ/RimL family protein N-acetyltransferase